MELKDFVLGVAVGLALTSAVFSVSNSIRIAGANADALAAAEFVRQSKPVLDNLVKKADNTGTGVSHLTQLFVAYGQRDNKEVIDAILDQYSKQVNADVQSNESK